MKLTPDNEQLEPLDPRVNHDPLDVVDLIPPTDDPSFDAADEEDDAPELELEELKEEDELD